MIQRNFIEELRSILTSQLSDEEKKKQLLQYHYSDIADLLDELDEDLEEQLLSILGQEEAAETILYSDDIGDIIEDLEPEHVADLIEEMDVDDAIDVLEELDEEQRDEIISLLDDAELKEDIEQIFSYDEYSLGSKMTTNYISITTNDTVKTAMSKVINQASKNDNVAIIYVLDDEDKFYGTLDLRDLIIARDTTDLKSIIKTNYPYFIDTELVEDVLPRLIEYGLDSYPIVNSENMLVGVITADDVIEVVHEELGDDYAKLGGLTEEEEITEGIFQSVKKRIPWLIILLILGLVQSFTMTGFEAVVATLPIIVFFQTLVLGMAGNSGTQSLAVTIRLLSSEEDSHKLIRKALFKELRIGMLNGLILALCAFAFVFLFLLITKQGVSTDAFSIIEGIKGAGIVAGALAVSMSISSFMGAFIPVIFSKIGVDPAVASGPFITTINDITALLVYYGLAMLLFNIVM